MINNGIVAYLSEVSISFYVVFTMLALATLFSLRNCLGKLLLELDRSCISVIWPSLSKRKKLLKWASSRLPLTWSSPSRTLSGGISDLWVDGSLLCTLINTAVPGACHNPHKHWQKPPIHGQALAYKYLGVVPLFTDQDFTNGFNINQERNFIHYLNQIQIAMNEVALRENSEIKVCSSFLLRGMGLTIGDQYTETVFYIYPNRKSYVKKENLEINIRGPYGTFGKAIVPSFEKCTLPKIRITDESMDSKTFFSKQIQNDFFMNLIKIKRINKQNKISNDIDIQIEIEENRAKITYIPNNFGIFEINVICNGELLRGCPYIVSILENVTSSRENSSTVKSNEIVKNSYKKLSDLKQKISNNHKLNNADKEISNLKNNCINESNMNKNNDEEKGNFKNSFFESNKNDLSLNKINNRLTVNPAPISHSENTTENQDKVNFVTKNIFDKNIVKNEKNIHSKDDNKKNECYNNNDKNANMTSNIDNENNVKNFPKIPDKKYHEYFTIYKKQIDLTEDKFDNNSKETSPICPEHIVSEVRRMSEKFSELPLTEKRKLFRETRAIIQTSQNSSFSENENVGGSRKELNIFNILRSFKKPKKQYLLMSSASLPNLNSLSSRNLRLKIDFWEELSNKSHNSSCNDISNIPKRRTNRYFSLDEAMFKNHKFNNILSYSKSLEKFKSYKFSDNTLDDCTSISIEERKKKLLIHYYKHNDSSRKSKLYNDIGGEFLKIKDRIKFYEKLK